uniref:RNA helicase n=1 Tax=Kalanchoe fedtschenkoi TaxID=63787 RepID=A0A7N0T8I7_KALFE
MSNSWADSVAAADCAAKTKPAYVPPHLRNRPAADTPAPAYTGPAAAVSNRIEQGGGGWGAPRFGGGGGGRGWGNRNDAWSGRDKEVNPFGDDDDNKPPSEQENTGINFDAYEDIPVDVSGNDIPPPVNTFAEIDLGDALNQNIRRCKYVRPTPVQRHTIPISLAGRDLMACAQTGSGKTAAFCFPIISGIMKSQAVQRPPRGARVVYPLALILSPTRELSCQIHEEAKKFSYQTGVKVVVVYGGAPVNQQKALTLVFVETKKGADALENWLYMNGFPATTIHGDRSQQEREQALRSFKSGRTPILVATDVAARGLDIPHVAHVVNFDLPNDVDDYVHRIGRTGRAGKSGLATAFFNENNLSMAKPLADLMQESNQEVPAWLVRYASRASYGGGKSRRGGGSGGRFGGRDFRKDNSYHRGGSDYYNGGGSGGGYYGAPGGYGYGGSGGGYGGGAGVTSAWD